MAYHLYSNSLQPLLCHPPDVAKFQALPHEDVNLVAEVEPLKEGLQAPGGGPEGPGEGLEQEYHSQHLHHLSWTNFHLLERFIFQSFYTFTFTNYNVYKGK